MILAAAIAAVCLAISPLSQLLGLLLSSRHRANIVLDDSSTLFSPRASLFHRVPVQPTKLPGNVTLAQYNAARTLGDAAMEKQEEINRAQLSSPSRNQYTTRPGGRQALFRQPRVKVTSELAMAARLIDSVDVLNESPLNQTLRPINVTIHAAAAGPFWMENIKRMGWWPWGNNPSHVVRSLPMILGRT